MVYAEGVLRFFSRHPRRLFLFDSAGGFLTAALIGGVLVPHQPLIGIPSVFLYVLATLGFGCGLYSLACAFFFRGSDFRGPLKLVMALNLLYCAVTLSMLLHFSFSVTRLGVAYFLGEVLVILSLVLFERRFLQGNAY